MRRRFLKRKLTAAIVSMALILQVGLLAPSSAYAQWAVTDPGLYAILQAEDVVDTAQETIKQALVAAIGTALINLLTYMANQVAYDSAVWIASGGNADEPLFDPRLPGDYFQDVGEQIVADLYSDLISTNIDGGILTEFSVYMPDDPELLQALRTGVRATVQGYVPEVDYPEVSANFDGYLATLSLDDSLSTEEKTVEVLSVIAEGFDPRVSELGAGLQVQVATVNELAVESQISLDTFIRDLGFQPVVDEITQAIYTPANFLSDDLQHSIELNKESPFNVSTALLSNSDGLLQIGIGASQIFTNTLLSELLNKWRTGLFEDVVNYPEFGSGFDPFDEDSTASYSLDRILESYSALLSFRPLEVSDYSLLSELSSCPITLRGSAPGLFNCALDSSFSSAVARADSGSPLTLSEAIEQGYIDGDWPLIPSSDQARNQDTKCYTYGFCHSNLVKLRKARIISTGWEIAAESDANSESDPVTLQEVIDGFHQCNSDGERDSQYPWCHLIDPDWVLKFPDTQCRTLVYGQLLSASGTDERAEECVDIQSCVSEDEYGNCTGGYGYCVREKNVWRFRGDRCPEEYASCQSFTSSTGEAIDYLTNTLDYGDCSESNQGCLWYATQKEEGEEDAFDWPAVENVELADEQDDAYKNRIYFNGSVEECDEENGGCSEVIVRTDDLRLNIMSNGSFENDDDSDESPDAWISSGATYDTENDEGRTGDAAMNPGASGFFYKYGVVMQQSRFYTFSFYAKQPDSSSSNSLTAAIFLGDSEGNEVDLTGTSYDSDNCEIADYDGGSENEVIQIASASPSSDDYERFECTFTTPTLDDSSLDIYAIVDFFSGDVWIDDVQLEQAEDASSYHVAYNDDSPQFDYVKLAPEYLGCTGASDDPEACENYASMCTEQEAGCSLYIPTNGDPSISAVTNELDECPSVCSGYDTFRQEETLYEPDGDFPVYFIPSTAEECSEDAVGCDEFTNLETEQREYFTYLRACITEEQAEENGLADGAATFYTWEGSDEEGYQLKTWQLLESDLTYGSITHADSGEVDSNPGAAPCTHWLADSDGTTLECYDDVASPLGSLDSDTDACDEHDDIITNPDCREFYDVDGNIHYRQWSETVTVNNACVTYRKTDTVGEDASAQEDNCEDSGGYWDTEGGYCRYFGFNEESTLCDESESGCRAYTGGRSGNSRVAFQDLFESGSLEDWDTGTASSVEISNESIARDGHSLKSDGIAVWTFMYEETGGCSDADGCEFDAGTLGGSCTVREGDTYCGTLHNQLFTGKTYTLSFWAKGSTDLDVGFDMEANGTSPSIDVSFEDDPIELESDWQEFSVGPLDMNENDYPDFGAGTLLAFVPDSSGEFYIDNVVLREGEDDITVIKDSWSTPATCDQTNEGAVSPQYHLGCQEYTSHLGDTAYLKSFSRLCDEEKVGCSAFFTTQESDSAYVEVHNATCYNVDDDGQTCDDGFCSATGNSCSTDSDCNNSTWDYGVQADSKTTCYMSTSSDGTTFDEDTPELCTIIAGDNSCQFDFEGWFIPETLLDEQAGLFHIDYGPDATFVNADADLYAIVSDDVRCESSGAGCTELGQPTFSADQSSVDEWNSVYLLNDPDSYDDILCSSDELFCAEWDAGSDGTWYFKTPGSHVCEYKTDITIGGQAYDGWFQKDTSEFCYGTGSCTEDTSVACETDADCAEVGAGECNVTSGSYLIGGDESGIWRNGDEEYDGWVGTCTAEWDGCTNFQDPLDFDDDEFYGETDGEEYHYIDNDNLNEGTLLSSQRCNDQVSQKFGCALFNDTGDTGQDYSSAASYIASARADELFGYEPFSLVDPVDCSDETSSTINTPSGESVDLCAQRCVWAKEDLDTDFDASEVDSAIGEYTFGGSCYDDSDCQHYEANTGDLVQGTCETSVTGSDEDEEDVERLENDTNTILKVTRDRTCSEWLTCASSYTVWDDAAGKYRTICDGIDLCTDYSGDNSASFCSAWDADDPAVIFDQDKYIARDVSWYGEEYSGYAVPGIYPLQHLSQINIAPPAGLCDMSSFDEDDPAYTTYHGEECTTSIDCGGDYCVQEEDDEYRLGYVAGECTGDHAESCTVGYCESTGSACVDSEDCEDESDECITGVCYVVSEETCSEDSNCSGDQECLSGTCVEDAGNCDTSFSCSDSAATCFSSEATKIGACYRSSCFVSLGGDEFDDDVHEGQVCRGQPEISSPFSNEVVEEWIYLDRAENALRTTETVLNFDDYAESGTPWDSTTDATGGVLPNTFRSGFSAVTTCATGENCECSYQKVQSSSDLTGYIDLDTNLDTHQISGICSSSTPMAGAFCVDDFDCYDNDGDDTAETDLGVSAVGVSDSAAGCEPITSEDTFYGLEGYCLERDSGLNINGDQNTGACLTWFPVDQLAGSTDLYAKYTSAGYFEDEYYCSSTVPFVSLRTSSADLDSYIACAAGDGAVGTGDSYDMLTDTCSEMARCPRGYFAVVGQPAAKSHGYTGSAFTSLCSYADNDCPYICVPEGSTRDSDGSSCVDPESDEVVMAAYASHGCSGEQEEFGYDEDGDGDDDVRVFTWACNTGSLPGTDSEEEDELVAFNKVVNAYDDCVVEGIPLDTVEDALQHWAEHPSNEPDVTGGCYEDLGDRAGYMCLTLNYDIIPACNELIQVSGAAADDNNSAPWTDRLYIGGAISASATYLEYEEDTWPQLYGASYFPPSDAADRGVPPRVAACYDEAYAVAEEAVDEFNWESAWTGYSGGFSNYLSIPTGDINACGGSTVVYDPHEDDAHDLSEPEARSYIPYEWDGGCVGESSDCTDLSDKWSVTGGKTDIFGRLTQIFAKLDGLDEAVWQWNDGFYDRDEDDLDEEVDFSFDASSWGDVGYDSAYDSDDYDVRAAEGQAPRVWSVDTDNCGPRYCKEGSLNALTINNSDDGDQEASDYFRATLKFFAAANKDQLPIRRVWVDWGDGYSSGSDDDENYYKNHRGLQDGEDGGSEDTDTLSKCDLGSEWGLTDDSCDPNHFTYQHVYRCTGLEDLNGCIPDDNGNLTESPCTYTGEECVYQPRVHVRDNWGWCAGTCNSSDGSINQDGSVDGDTGCFDSDGGLSSPERLSECNYDRYPDADSDTDPWVYYDGNIIVEP